MERWTTRRILISSVFIFSILAASFWQWGNVADFTKDNQFNPENYFGLNMSSDDGQIIINHNILGPLLWAMTWAILLLIWRKRNIDGELQVIFSMLTVIITSYFLYHSGTDISSILGSLILSAPIAWGLFWLGLLTFGCRCNPSNKTSIWSSLILFILVGGMVHGWFGGLTNHLLLGSLSMTLHILGALSWIVWLIIICAIALLVALLALGLIIAILAILIIISLIAIVLFIIIIILLVIACYFIILGLLGGETPQKLRHEVGDFLEEFFG